MCFALHNIRKWSKVTKSWFQQKRMRRIWIASREKKIEPKICHSVRIENTIKNEKQRENRTTNEKKDQIHTLSPNHFPSIYFFSPQQKVSTPIISVYSSAIYCYYTFASVSHSNVTIFSLILNADVFCCQPHWYHYAPL